ncbi:MAG: hypothetical protein K2O16_02010 [Lachnospiraceae bacterium]|nr:hypothetical protein [Lachnospiraceae bacterium]
MEKEASYSMSKGIFEMASRPLRSRQEAILLLLYTIRMFEVDELIAENKTIKVVISINKMNRIFYVLEDKIFSMQFPFFVEMEHDKIARIYDTRTGLDIDSRLVSTLIGIFEKTNTGNSSFDSLFDEIMYCGDNLPNVGIEQIWEVVKFISTYDLGYLRYDYDEKHKKGLLHPVNHLDICLDTAAAYKIGLKKSLNYEMFKDILDTTTNCFFLNV